MRVSRQGRLVEGGGVMGHYCECCYMRKVYCRKCKTTHCGCSWNQCPVEEKEEG